MRKSRQLGRYHLLDRIAFGGMAEIFRAKTFDGSGHAHLVAVKRILAHLAEEEDFVQMLVDEAKITSVLKHPNIARVYEFAKSKDEYFIAMEHVDGKDLRTILERCRKQKKVLAPYHAAYIAGEISKGLHAAHVATDHNGRSLKIVHRDVSPSNIICSYTGEVKLCDFGIAKATVSKIHTQTGVIKGKVKYMSPEQALGRRLDARSDIFAIGTVMYEMLTRRPPFTASNEMDLLIKVRNAKYRPLSSVLPSIPAELEAIVDRCLNKSRSQRYQSAANLHKALKRFLDRTMPGYTRSHLGRTLRNQFSEEIEKELRKLEEFVLSDNVTAEVGENLLGLEASNTSEVSKFTANPIGQSSVKGSSYDDEEETMKETPHTAKENDRLANPSNTPSDFIDQSYGSSDDDYDARDDAIHNSPTLILDHRRGWTKKKSE